MEAKTSAPHEKVNILAVLALAFTPQGRPLQSMGPQVCLNPRGPVSSTTAAAAFTTVPPRLPFEEVGATALLASLPNSLRTRRGMRYTLNIEVKSFYSIRRLSTGPRPNV